MIDLLTTGNKVISDDTINEARELKKIGIYENEFDNEGGKGKQIKSEKHPSDKQPSQERYN